MQSRTRHIIIGLCSLAIVGSVIAYAATGAYPYSHSRDTEIESANAQSDLTDLFGEAAPEDVPPPKAVKSINAIGLLPSGPGMESISVASISGPSLAVIVLMLWMGHREKKHAAAASTMTRPAEPQLNS